MSNQAGFSLLELVVVIAIISILVAVALDRLLPYIDEAERVSVIRLEGQLRSTLVLEAAERIVQGRSASITELNGSNPVNFLAEPPKNYTGAVKNATEGSTQPRHWFFDESRGELVYRLGEAYARKSDIKRDEDPAFSVHVAYDDRDRNGRFNPGKDELYGVRLVRVAGTGWLEAAQAH